MGETKPNVLLTLTLIDPDKNEVKSLPIHSDKLGKITEESFRVPSEAKTGTWEINANSGSNFDVAEFEVISSQVEGLRITVEEAEQIPTVGKILTIKSTMTSQMGDRSATLVYDKK